MPMIFCGRTFDNFIFSCHLRSIDPSDKRTDKTRLNIHTKWWSIYCKGPTTKVCIHIWQITFLKSNFGFLEILQRPVIFEITRFNCKRWAFYLQNIQTQIPVCCGLILIHSLEPILALLSKWWACQDQVRHILQWPVHGSNRRYRRHYTSNGQ